MKMVDAYIHLSCFNFNFLAFDNDDMMPSALNFF